MKTRKTFRDYAYTAGYIDGDGCFHIGISIPGKNRSPKYRLNILISSVNKCTLLYFKNTFGGSVNRTTKASGNSRDLYCWSLAQEGSKLLIPKLLPYLVEKKEEALLAMQFIKERDARFIEKMHILKKESNLVNKEQKNVFESRRCTIIPSDDDFAYLAGFIDAECSLGIQKYKMRDRPYPIYKIILQCNNTKAPVFDWILQRFGGSIHFIDRTNYSCGRKSQFTWRQSSKQLYDLLQHLKKYLRYKKPVCMELIKLYEAKKLLKYGPNNPFYREHIGPYMELRESIFNKVHKLNLKGKKPI